MTLREKVTRRRIGTHHSDAARVPARHGWHAPLRRYGPVAARQAPRPVARLLALVSPAAAATTPSAPAGETRSRATVLLDFTPNAVHAGIYMARARHDERRRPARRSASPSASTDALKLLQAGRVDLAILDIHDLGLARQAGADLVGVMALVQRPLAAVLARPGIARPRELEGRRAGVTGLPSDRAVLRSVVAGDGGDPEPRARDHDRVRGGARRCWPAAWTRATAFWNVEGVALRARRPADARVPRRRLRRARLPGAGAVRDPETLRAAARARARRGRATCGAATTRDAGRPGARRRGADAPRRAWTPPWLRAQLAAVAPRLPGARAAGTARSTASVLRAWAAWDVRFGILDRPPDVERAFDLQLAG